jgi:WD40 repeat protein
MTDHFLSRRAVLGAVGGAVALTALAGPADADTADAATTRGSGRAPRIVPLGPGIEQYALMSSVLLDGVAYIGSRNLATTGVIAVDVAAGLVTASTTVGNGYSIQALALDPVRRLLYIGILQKSAGTAPNLFRWDLATPAVAATPIGRIGDRDVRDLAVSPDGVLFAVGGGGTTAPALWQYDPATAAVTSLGVPDPAVTLARAVAATDAAVYFGAGSTLGGGAGTSRAALHAFDRATGAFANITPAEMVADPSIRELAVDGDRLLVSTAGAARPSTLASLSLADPASYTSALSIGKTAKSFARIDDTVYAANETGVVAWDTAAGTVEQLDLAGLELGEIWGLDPLDGDLVATSGYAFLARISLPGTDHRLIDLGEAGAPVGPQTCMGIAVGAGSAYVGGNGGIARHDLATGAVVNLRAPGEAKDAEVIDGVLHTGQYSGQGIWAYDPASPDPIRQVARFPEAQNRPLDTEYDESSGLLLVAAQADTEGGGSIWTYDPATGASTIAVNPIDSAQLVRAVTAVDGVAYLGGDNAQKTGPRGTVVAWDPVSRTELWRLETGQATGIAALSHHGRHLFAITIKGIVLVIDRVTRSIVHTSDQSALCPGFAAMTTARGHVYVVSDTTLFRIDPRSFDVTVVVPAIDGGWYSGPHLAADADGALYTLRGRDLVRVDDCVRVR